MVPLAPNYNFLISLLDLFHFLLIEEKTLKQTMLLRLS
ncbi:hypothetical protein SZ39_4313 [Bacillus mycoides]|nr:hypothetical protein SZ39_4313 [Bacillus mycoides]